MTEDELVKIWQSSPKLERVKFEKSRLMIDVQSKLDDFNKKIKYRDLREVIAFVIVAPVFAYYIYSVPFMLTKVASALIIICGIFVVVRLRNAKKHLPAKFTETYLEYLSKSRKYIELQKRMLDTVLYWYILPFWASLSLFVAGFKDVPGKLPWIIQTESMNVALGVAIYFLNKYAVKKSIVPVLRKIDELIKTLESN